MSRLRPLAVVPLLTCLCALALTSAGSASAEVLVVKGKVRTGQAAKFRVGALRTLSPRSGRISARRYSRRLSKAQLRRAARRGVLRLRLPRRVTRSRRAVLRVRVPDPPRVRAGRVNGKLAGFESGDFSELFAHSTSGGTLSTTTESAYEGARAAKATYTGSGSTAFQRVWENVAWKSGSDVWYGMAVRIPDPSSYCYWNPIRWDNYKTYGGQGDVGGLAIEQGKVAIIQNRYGGSERQLTTPVSLPADRWVWMEVHQRLSASDGEALSELFLDGRKVGSSTRANSAGRNVDNIRFGAVNVASSCSRPGSVLFDRISITDGMRGAAS